MKPDYKDTFRGTAWYYARFREGHPAEFFDLIEREFNLSKSNRVLDLGCGTGQIAIPVSVFVKEVIAMDPEPEMIAEGKTQAEINNAQNITWIEGGSEDLLAMKANLGSFKLVTMGTSFHWMDREKTLEELHEIITGGGGIAIVWNTSIWTRSSTLDEVVGNLYSTSMANPNILDDDKDAFEKELREALLKVNPDGIFTSEGDLEAILAWK
jgi:ubiquinone/menaquinone biosynthesis C-methylase UbiE